MSISRLTDPAIAFPTIETPTRKVRIMELIITVLAGIAVTVIAAAIYRGIPDAPAPVVIAPVATAPVESPHVELRPTPAELAATARAVRESRSGDPETAARELIADSDRGIVRAANDGRASYVIVCDNPAVQHRVSRDYAARGFTVSRPSWGVLCVRWDLED